jgi:hypothetical protein
MTAMAQTARTEAANTAKNATDKAAEVTRETAGRAEDAARRGVHVIQRTAGAASEVQREVAHRSADATADLVQVLVDLINEQTRHNVQIFHALTQTVDWGQAAQLQSEFLRTSLKRTGQFTRRYFEVSQAVMTSALSTAGGQAKKVT